MPNTGIIQSKGFKHDIYMKKLQEFQQRNIHETRNQKHQSLANASLLYSRYIPRGFKRMRNENYIGSQCDEQQLPPRKINLEHLSLDGPKTLQRNKLAPFSTLGKATCGFNFSRDTDNKKKNFGIMPSNLVKWRSDKIEKVPVN